MARDKRGPCSGWVRRPRHVAVREAHYQYIVDAYKTGFITLSTLLEWYEICFDGVVPEWVRTEQVVHRDPSLWGTLRNRICDEPRPIPAGSAGYVFWNSDIYVDTRFSDRVAHEELTTTLEQVFHTMSQGLTLNREEGKLLRLAYPSCTIELAMRVTEDPVSTYELVRLAGVSDFGPKDYASLARHMLGMGGQALTNTGQLMLFNPVARIALRGAMRAGILNKGLEHMQKCLKIVSDVSRQSNRSWCPPLGVDDGLDANNLLYIHGAIGRYYFKELTSTDEIDKRSEPMGPQTAWHPSCGWSAEYFESLEDCSMNEILAPFFSGKQPYKDLTPERFVARAFLVGSTGSASQARKMEVEYDGKRERLSQPSKLAWLVNQPPSTVARLLADNAPCVRGTGIDKYEVWKLRLLLPGPITHWLAESIALLGGEGSVFRRIPSITMDQSPLDELIEVTHRLASIKAGEFQVAADASDFNLLHTYKRMAKQWFKLAAALDPNLDAGPQDCWGKQDFTKFSASACRWVALALTDVMAKGRLATDQYQVLVRGLWSGWRSTTFINTTMNLHYNHIVRTVYHNIHGYCPVTRTGILGDDVELAATSEYAGLRYLQIYNLIGLEAQGSKQLASDSRNEYLRRITTSDGIRGSLNRAICQSTSGDGQSRPYRAGPHMAQAINERLNIIIRRGGDRDAVEMVRYHSVGYHSAVTWWDGQTRHKIQIPVTVLRGSTASGGFGCARFGELPPTLVPSIEPMPITGEYTRTRQRRIVSQLPRPGTKLAAHEFVSTIMAVGGTGVKGSDVEMSLATSLLSSSAPAKAQMDNWNDVATLQADWVRDLPEVRECPRDSVDPRVAEIVEDAASGLIRTLDVGGTPRTIAEDYNTSVDTALAIAGGAAAPASEYVLHVKGLGDPIQTVTRLGGAAAARKLQHVVADLGPRVANAMIRGKYRLDMPYGGVIPSTHRAMVYYCLRAAINKLYDPFSTRHTVDEQLHQLQSITDSTVLSLFKWVQTHIPARLMH